MKQLLLDKIKNRQAVIGIIGLGYVGLPLAVSFLKKGYKVIGIDVSKKKIASLKKGISYVQDVSSEDVQLYVGNRKFQVTDNYKMLKETDCVSIAVPTPLSKSKNPDLSFVVQAVEGVLQNISGKDYLIVLESTTYPGTTREFIVQPLIDKNAPVGESVFVCFSPERVDPGNKKYQTENTPKIMGGYTKNCLEVGSTLYGSVLNNIVKVNSLEEAEMAKLLENTFRAVNIALVNEMALMCDRMGIDIWNVINAAATKPFGFMPFYPGPGIGGHCIPLDPQYLSWKAKTFGFFNRFIELASDINANMPRFVIDKAMLLLNERQKPVKGSKILVLGVSYKKDVNDLRESPAFDIINSLIRLGAKVDFADPYFDKVCFDDKVLESVELTDDNLKKYDMVILTTNHSTFDLKMIASNSALIFDTRNAFKDFNNNNIKRL
jgi:UDP-N-acetyl-D-glucosamine dehydrogenase